MTSAFLQVDGETDPLALHALFFGPAAVAGLGCLAVGEAGVRRVLARLQ